MTHRVFDAFHQAFAVVFERQRPPSAVRDGFQLFAAVVGQGGRVPVAFGFLDQLSFAIEVELRLRRQRVDVFGAFLDQTRQSPAALGVFPGFFLVEDDPAAVLLLHSHGFLSHFRGPEHQPRFIGSGPSSPPATESFTFRLSHRRRLSVIAASDVQPRATPSDRRVRLLHRLITSRTIDRRTTGRCRCGRAFI
jgi:hypothetical protein